MTTFLPMGCQTRPFCLTHSKWNCLLSIPPLPPASQELEFRLAHDPALCGKETAEQQVGRALGPWMVTWSNVVSWYPGRHISGLLSERGANFYLVWDIGFLGLFVIDVQFILWLGYFIEYKTLSIRRCITMSMYHKERKKALPIKPWKAINCETHLDSKDIKLWKNVHC